MLYNDKDGDNGDDDDDDEDESLYGASSTSTSTLGQNPSNSMRSTSGATGNVKKIENF